MDQNKLKEAAAAARNCERLYGIPGKLMLAQWALESGWGEHAPGNNCFGIKEYRGCYGTQELETSEFVNGRDELIKQTFATFPSIEHCFVERAEMFSANPFYAKARQAYAVGHDAELYARAIAPIYATDPNYAEKIVAMMRGGHLIAAFAAAPSGAFK